MFPIKQGVVWWPQGEESSRKIKQSSYVRGGSLAKAVVAEGGPEKL